MAHVRVHHDRADLVNPVFVDGLPGLGLVAKLAADHLIETFGMTVYASVECPGLPPVVTYRGGQRVTLPPVRVYADEPRNLLVLQTDVAISPQVVSDFTSCLSGLVADHDALPLYVSGRPMERDPPTDDRELSGIATGTVGHLLEEFDVDPPAEDGVWRGPTGALLNVARGQGLNALGLIVEADRTAPDPAAACVLLEDAIAPIAGVDVDVSGLRDRAAAIREEKREFAQAMDQPTENESSRAEPLRMYQ